jgi:predicted PurR-regulated permease PerM
MSPPERAPNQLIENGVRIGIIALLLYASLRILSPFLDLVVWGIIVAVALAPAHSWLMERLGASALRAAILLTAAALLFVVLPSLALGDALGSTAYRLAGDLQDGSVEIPPPSPSVKEWPVIGGQVHQVWLQASTNLDALLARSSDRLVELGGQLLRAAGSAILALAQFGASLVVAGFLLGWRERSSRLARDIFLRAAPEIGERLLRVTEQTVQGVAAGVLGVAIIQSTLVGVGLLVADVPYAGVWALLCLILGIVQLPIGMVVTPIVIYQFFNAPTAEAIGLFVYMVPVGLLDNVLRPLLMSRGVDAPMVVIIAGALGGFAVNGFLGLFTGAIILVLAYELLQVWLYGTGEDAERLLTPSRSDTQVSKGGS